ncbi:sugar ABC transporter permease [Eubacteriales bacterium OttesenSCG-928-N13]|nr:sugar ABC transporter permease [Eubacteriales bacterium OttesenSCG-928-N13]
MLYRDRRPLLVFLVPAFALMLVMLYYPFVLNIINSMFEIKGMAGEPQAFIGIQNYRDMFSDPTMAISIQNSLKMMGLTVIFQVGLALVLALMVDSIKKGQQFFRVVFFFPIVISATAIGLMFNLFYIRDGGMLNQILGLFGMDPVFWLDKSTAFTMVAIPVLWQYVGFYFVIVLTGLSSIPEDVYESAAIDGATGFKKTFYITLPLIRDVLITCATLSITGAIKVFDLPAVIVNNGKPNGLTYFLGTYMHNQTFVAGNIDYGSAIAVVIVLLGVIISQTVNRLLLRVGGEDA